MYCIHCGEPVVRVPVRAVNHGRHHGAAGRGVAKDVDHVSVLVHGTPQVLLPPLDLDEYLVQIPGVAHPASADTWATIRAPWRPLPPR